MITANNISLTIQSHTLLEDVSAVFEPGTFSVIVGANGAGKSTFLKVLTGDISPTHGVVHLREQAMQSYCPKRLAQQRSVMPQSSPLNFSFCVGEVVEMGRAPHSTICSAKENRTIAEQAMRDMDVYHLKERDYTTLSGGERQRVHLARVLAQVWEPKPYAERYILLDEPTASLDMHHQHQALAYLHTLSQHGVGIVVVLHDLNLASLYADTVFVMKQGRLAAQGSPQDVFHEELIADAFSYHAHIQQHPDAGCPLIIPAAQFYPTHTKDTTQNQESLAFSNTI